MCICVEKDKRTKYGFKLAVVKDTPYTYNAESHPVIRVWAGLVTCFYPIRHLKRGGCPFLGEVTFCGQEQMSLP